MLEYDLSIQGIKSGGEIIDELDSSSHVGLIIHNSNSWKLKQIVYLFLLLDFNTSK